jgi:hypothetical protein
MSAAQGHGGTAARGIHGGLGEASLPEAGDSSEPES